MPHFYRRDKEIFARKNSVLLNFWDGIMISASFSPGKKVPPHLQAESAPKFCTGRSLKISFCYKI